MTITFNPCLPTFGADIHGNLGLDGIKKGMVVEIFLIYLIYLFVISVGTAKKKYREQCSSKEELAKIVTAPKEENQGFFDKLDYFLFDRFFFPYFGFHSICVGTVLLYSPYAFSISIVWIHFVAFLVLLGMKIKLGDTQPRVLYGIYTFLQFLNIVLIFSSLISLGVEMKCGI